MSGVEVLGSISAVVAIIDGSIKVWKSAKKDIKLSDTFETVANRLPILRDTLQTCHEHFERIPSLPSDVANSLLKTVKSCENKADRLRTIFQETIPGEDDRWYERYRMVARRLGKGSRVEELMMAITEDAQHLVNYHTVKSTSPELCTQLEVIVEEMKSLEPSLPIEQATSQTFNAYGGPQNVSSGSSTQYNSFNTGSGTTHNYGGITGNPTFNFGTILSSRTNFAGSYAHSSLHPVSMYVARPELERKLQAQFPVTENFQTVEGMRTAVVWGLGGVGKSQLVLNYVQNQRQRYQAVFWIEAGQKETIQRDYIQIYKQLHRDTGKQAVAVSVEDAVTGVKEWLQQQERRCLWIMDSADDIDDSESESFIDLRYYLPEAPQLDRVLTTRSSRVEDLATDSAVAVREMGTNEAIQLFQKSARIEQCDEETELEVQRIVEGLGCLALAITLAGSYVRETPGLSSDLRRYRLEQETSRERLLSQRAHPLVHQYGESVLTTWESSIKAVQQRSQIAANLACLLAFLNADDIFLSMFKTGPVPPSTVESTVRSQHIRLSYRCSQLFTKGRFLPVKRIKQPTSSEQDTWKRLLSPLHKTPDYNEIVSAFKVLQAYSLVSWQADREAYSIHKLVHAWSHDRLDLGQRQTWSLAVLGLLNGLVLRHKGEIQIESRLVPHVMSDLTAVSSAHSPLHLIPEPNHLHLKTIGNLLYRIGRWDDEYQVRVLLFEVKEKALGWDHPDTLDSGSNLALVLEERGKYEQAETIHWEILHLREKVLGKKHPSTLASMNNVAVVLEEQGKYEQAATMQAQTIQLKQKVLGREHPDTLNSMNNLAITIEQQGDYDRAETLHRETLKLKEKVLSPEHPDTLSSMNNLAILLRQQGKYEQSAELQSKTLQLRKKVHGPEHPDTLASMNNLAIALEQLGKYGEAEELQAQTLQLKIKVLGLEHPSTQGSMTHLAQIFLAQGTQEEAEERLVVYLREWVQSSDRIRQIILQSA